MFGCAEFLGKLYTDIVGSGHEHIVYALCCLVAAGGAGLFLALQRMRWAVKWRLVLLAFALAALSLVLAGFIRIPAVLEGSFFVFYLAEGLNAALCAYCLHRLMRSKVKVGVALAASSTAGLVATYVLGFFSAPLYLSALLLAGGVLLMGYLAFGKINLWEFLESWDGESEVAEESNGSPVRLLPVLVTITAAIAVMSYMIGVNDVVIYTTLLSGSGAILFIFQELWYLPGLLIAGILADVKDGRLLPVATLACTLLAAPIATLTGSPVIFTEYSGVTYFLGGFYLIYLMVSLTAIAHKAKRPSAITTLAAFVFFLFSAVGALTSHIHMYTDSALSLVSYVALSALLLVTFYMSGSLHPKPDESAAGAAALSIAPLFEDLTERYGFTSREAETLQHLLNGCQNVDIAATMGITENTVYKYISSMIIKSNAKSRAGLIAMFLAGRL
jgi:DNA-binding CsgD family transcriptional regulator